MHSTTKPSHDTELTNDRFPVSSPTGETRRIDDQVKKKRRRGEKKMLFESGMLGIKRKSLVKLRCVQGEGGPHLWGGCYQILSLREVSGIYLRIRVRVFYRPDGGPLPTRMTSDYDDGHGPKTSKMPTCNLALRPSPWANLGLGASLE